MSTESEFAKGMVFADSHRPMKMMKMEYRVVRPKETIDVAEKAVRQFVVTGWKTTDQTITLWLRDEVHYLLAVPGQFTPHVGGISFGVQKGDLFRVLGDQHDSLLQLQILEVVAEYEINTKSVPNAH